MTKLFTKIIKL